MSVKTLLWIRNDLRVTDNAALCDAVEHGTTEVCFIVSEAQWRSHDVGERRFGLTYHGLSAFAAECGKLGLPLHLLQIPWFKDVPGELLALIQRRNVTRLVFNAEYPLNEATRDEQVTKVVRAAGTEVVRFHGNATLPPGTVTTPSGTPYKAFTPFKKKWLATVAALGCEPLPKPEPSAEPVTPTKVSVLAKYAQYVDPSLWPTNEQAARQRLDTFVDERIHKYPAQRDLPGVEGTSRLSACLSLGVISANQCLTKSMSLGTDGAAWTNELIWREFYKHIVALFPHVCQHKAFKPQMDDFRWRVAPDELHAWQLGETGFPLVDAAMRQLTETGWMHNRLRMLTAMFLSKHLLIDWREGEKFFMNQLIDGDFAANNGGWQWSASTGTDSVPYFRIFNPITQGQKFDSDGKFTRHFLPILKDVPKRHLYTPHDADMSLDYPLPIVEHKFARQRALDAFKA